MTSACLEGLSLDLYGPAGNSVEQTHPLGYFLPVQLFFPQKRLGMAAENDCSALTDDTLCVYLHPKLQPQFHTGGRCGVMMDLRDSPALTNT